MLPEPPLVSSLIHAETNLGSWGFVSALSAFETNPADWVVFRAVTTPLITASQPGEIRWLLTLCFDGGQATSSMPVQMGCQSATYHNFDTETTATIPGESGRPFVLARPLDVWYRLLHSHLYGRHVPGGSICCVVGSGVAASAPVGR